MKALLKLALRSLLVRRVNLLIGAFVVLGTLLLVVGGTVLSNIERSMSLSIVETMTGHVLVWPKSGPKPVDPLVLFSTDGTPRLEPIPDFPEVERALRELPGVRAVVPLGFSNATFRDRNLMDRLVEQMREALGRSQAGPADERAAAASELEALGAHAVQVAARLKDELIRSQAAVDLALLKEDLSALERVTAEAFREQLAAEPEAAFEFLENRIAPQLDGQGEIDIFHIGADLEVFRKHFQRLQLVEGELVPPGERGLLLSAFLYETAFKLPVARRLDQLKTALAKGRTLAADPELQEWLREAQGLVPALALQLGPKQNLEVRRRLAAALGAESTADVEALLRSLLAVDDANFEQRHALFYRDVAPFVQLYRARVGDLVPLRSEVPGGYPRSSLVRFYGTVEFRGLEKSDVAAVSLLDPSTFAELYGHLTPGERFEVEQMRRTAGVVELSREEAEARAFAAPIADLEVLDSAVAGVPPSFDAQAPVAVAPISLTAALFLDDPTQTEATIEKVRALKTASGVALGAVPWDQAAGVLSQVTNLALGLLYAAALVIFLATALTINNSTMMATFRRSREIGTLRAIGAQRGFVVALVLTEMLLVALFAGVLGVLLGAWILSSLGSSGIPADDGLLYFLFSGPRLFPVAEPRHFLMPLLAVTGVCLVATLMPALMAARVTPIRAMQSEEEG